MTAVETSFLLDTLGKKELLTAYNIINVVLLLFY